MATFHRFEEIEAWQLGRSLTGRIYALSNRGPFATDRALRDQMRRAAASIMANIAEGYERDGTKEFVQFLSIAKGSVGEVRSFLYGALDQQYITPNEFDERFAQCTLISRKLQQLMDYLRESQFSGRKYSKFPSSQQPET